LDDHLAFLVQKIWPKRPYRKALQNLVCRYPNWRAFSCAGHHSE